MMFDHHMKDLCKKANDKLKAMTITLYMDLKKFGGF